MHIHKINTTSQEHQSFLAQNRIDPITGDAILEGDEVVFCAGCKSVFLRDSWKYLGEKHCGEAKTLANFPIQKVMRLKVEDGILFYTSLPNSGKSQVNIPRKAKKKPWIKKAQNVSPYQNLLHNPFVKATKIATFVLFYALFIIKSEASFFPLIYIPFILEGITWLHDWYYGRKIETIYQNFAKNTFYITKKTIGFASRYGIYEYVLPVENIDQITFHEKNGFLTNSYCQIFYKKDGMSKTLKFKIDTSIFSNSYELFLALNTLSINQKLNIRIESKKENTLYYANKMIAEGNSNFWIANL